MSALILHHYPQSHFAEKIKRVLAFKDVPWSAVEQPMVMPKPDLVPLTGGFRRIPVLQVGADVYVDSVLIARVIEALHPAPVCIPAAQAGLIGVIEAWAGRQFMFQVLLPTFAALLPDLSPEFLADRAAMSPGLSRDAIVAGAPHALTQADLVLDQLEQQLRAHPFLLGAEFTLADASVFFPLWLFKNSQDLFAHIEVRPAVAAWFARIEAFGAGRVESITAAAALAAARDAEPAPPLPGLPSLGDLRLGDDVEIVADDYGVEACRGTVTHLSEARISVLRHDEDLGAITVHFPRAGYRIARS